MPEGDAPSASFRVHALLAAAVGVSLAFATLDARFLLGVGPKWSQPTDDLTAYVVAATYYLHDSWRFPVWAIPRMGYPEGGSIIYNDAIPVAALAAKLLATATGWHVNYLGPWVLLCYALMAVLAARLAFVLGNRSAIASMAFAAFTTGCTAFMTRMHIALTAQFVIYWAFLAYLRVRQPDVNLTRVVLPPLLVTFLINPYLFAMIAPIILVGVASVCRLPAVRRQVFVAASVVSLALAIVIFVGGYVPRFHAKGSFGSWGYGYFSWNAATLVIPPAQGFWEPMTKGIVRDATGGQYEGESYLGFAPLCLLVWWVSVSWRDIPERIHRHRWLALLLVGYAIFALSNHAYLRSLTLWNVELPDAVAQVVSIFRASARFIWPTMYLLLILPGIYLGRRVRRPVWIGALTAAAVFQVFEGAPRRQWLRQWTASPSPDLVNVAVFSDWLQGHARVWQYPSWFCGGLGSYTFVGDYPREYQIEAMAAQANIPTNSVYMSRPLKDCERERWEAAALTKLKPDVLYIFSNDVIDGLPNIHRLTESAACRDSGWGWVCSRRFGNEQTPQPTARAGQEDDGRRSQ